MKVILTAGVILAAMASVSSSSSSAASPSPVITPASELKGNRVLVLRVESLGEGTVRAVVIRRPAGQSTHDFILVNASTTPADLAKAVATLMFSHRSKGPSVTSEMRAEVSPAASPAGLKSKDSQRATRDLARLARAQVVSIEGIGRGPAIGITTAKVAAIQKKK